MGARGIRMVAIGTETGVWMGIEGDTNNLRKVLPTDYVTQIGVLEEYHVFLVLSGKEEGKKGLRREMEALPILVCR